MALNEVMGLFHSHYCSYLFVCIRRKTCALAYGKNDILLHDFLIDQIGLLGNLFLTYLDSQDNIVSASGRHDLFVTYFNGNTAVAAQLCDAVGSPGTP